MQLELPFFNNTDNIVDKTNQIALTVDNTLPTSYRLHRSKRRSLAITVDQGHVIVRAPLRAPKSWIDSFVIEKASWIQKQLIEQRHQETRIIRIKNGMTLTVLDQPLTIRITKEPLTTSIKPKRPIITATNNELVIKTFDSKFNAEEKYKNSVDSYIDNTVKEAFFRWIKTVAENYMTPTTIEYAQNHGLVGKLADVKYRRTKSKWGHCTSAGNIQYNPIIMLAPKYVIDYIISHELCHLQHANHSKTFWRFVEKVCPDWKSAESWLRDEGYTLSI